MQSPDSSLAVMRKSIRHALTISIIALAVVTLAAAALTALPLTKPPARPSHQLDFPAAADGRQVLSIDPHIHTVFSDGRVWPDVRVWEARRDLLDAISITEHLEIGQRHQKWLDLKDRNQSFLIAAREAELTDPGEEPLVVIRGVEITRKLPPGHVNGVFVTDVNPILTMRRPEEDTIDTARQALTIANRQGAFTFWNHPALPKSEANGKLIVSPEQQKLFDDRLIRGIEVVNGRDFFESAFQFALENNLTVLGTSDTHRPIDHEYDFAGGEHRTVTLALAAARTPQAIKAALEARQSAALYFGTIVGRPAEVEAILRGALKLNLGEPNADYGLIPVIFTNAAPVAMTLRMVGSHSFVDASDTIVVPARGTRKADLFGHDDKAPFALEVEVVNTRVAPRTPLRLTLRPGS
jgi:3',5'-nucleoside bisphosphate phosphatase